MTGAMHNHTFWEYSPEHARKMAEEVCGGDYPDKNTYIYVVSMDLETTRIKTLTSLNHNTLKS